MVGWLSFHLRKELAIKSEIAPAETIWLCPAPFSGSAHWRVVSILTVDGCDITCQIPSSLCLFPPTNWWPYCQKAETWVPNSSLHKGFIILSLLTPSRVLQLITNLDTTWIVCTKANTDNFSTGNKKLFFKFLQVYTFQYWVDIFSKNWVNGMSFVL